MAETLRLRRGRRVLSGAVAIGTLTAGVLALWSASFPSSAFSWSLLALGAAGLTLLVWTGLVVVCAMGRRFDAALILPVVAASLVLVAVGVDLPLQTRFALSRAAFEQVMVDRERPGGGYPCPERIGSFRIITCLALGSNTFFIQPESGFLDTAGFAYLPNGVPKTHFDRAGRTFSPLSCPWYTYTQDW